MAFEGLGIDPRVAAALEAHGIKELYPPQVEAWNAVRTGRNVLVAIPTASGKSLVAYMAILSRFLATGRKALYIVPLRALASEKYAELQEFKSVGITVGLATGDLDETDPRLGRYDVVVCTSEKADALLRHRSSWITEVGCVVADELHLINDAGRGPTLEVILSRFRQLTPDAQIVGLSATVQNAALLAAWLGGVLVQSTWRPVSLKLGTYCGDTLAFLGEKPRNLPAAGEPVTSLVEQTLREGGQCLVFVSTRRSAEAQATRLGGPVRDLLDADAKARLEEAVVALDGDDETSPTARKLSKLVRAGVAFHTAGLDSAQRRFVETQFRRGLIKVLCATPTLAAGVNTPARRVIVRDLMRFEVGEGNRPLPVMDVKQMMGRAGRPRYDPYGEAVILVKDETMREAAVEEYLLGEPEPVESKLAGRAALQSHALASVAGGYAETREVLNAFFLSTLWATQVSAWIVADALEDALSFLVDHGFLEEKGGRLTTTPFGQRTSDLYVDPLSALRLREALESGAAATPFGLLEAVAGCPDLRPLYLRRDDEWVQERFWRHHEELLVASDGRDLESALSYAKTAFLLEDWMEEVRLDELEVRYGIGPGDIRMRLENGAWMLHAFGELARSLRPEWHGAISDLGIRLEEGVKAELLPIIALRGIGRVRARSLWRAGFRSVASLRGVTATRLSEIPGIGRKLADDLVQQLGAAPAEDKGQVTLGRYHPR
ncbi:MAG: DEAD/DEAH box helicase [Thermoplasmatota archaeon]